MNTKTCPNCGQNNPIQQAFCHRCGKPFANSAPNNYGGQPNFQNQPNFVQPPNNFQPQFIQPKKSSNKTLWWILGGGGVLAGLGLFVLILFMLGVFVAIANEDDTTDNDTTETKQTEKKPTETKPTETKPTLEGTRWRAQDGRTYTFGTNKRVTLTSPDGSQTFNGDLKIDGQVIQMKMDMSPAVITANWSISGNKLTLFNPQIGTTDIVTRIE